MKNRFVLFSVFYLVVVSSVFGQENMLRYEVQQAKNANVHFDSVAFSSVGAETRVLDNFVNANEVFFLGNISLDVKSNQVKAMNLTIPMNNKNMVLELVEVPEYFYNYKVLIMPDSIIRPANRDIKHYRGVVRDETNSLVAITFYNDEIMGLVCTDDGNFNIAKDSLSGKHLFYNDRNLKDTISPLCATEEDPSVIYDSTVLFSQRNNLKEDGTVRGMVINKIVWFYVETRVQFYRKLGRDLDEVEAWVMNIFNQVALLYLNEDIMTGVSMICMWHGGDPYTNSAGAQTLLKEFKDRTTSIQGDLGILLGYFKDSKDGEGIASSFNGLCNHSVDNKLAVARINTFYENFPVYSRSVKIVTHELGHLFGSRHTHACVWNGNNTAIDGCAGGVEGNCSLPDNPPSGGTIMSYCDKPKRPGVNFNLGFGEQPGNVIRTNVINASCLETCDVNIRNQIISVNTTASTPCGNVNIQNVKVQSNSKLTIDADKETTIDGDFEIELGSELEIK